jgi:DNA-binding beta-propeller fold protein YncE
LSMTAPAGAQWTQGTLFNVVATPTASVPSNSLTLDLVVAPPPGSIPNNQTSYLRTDDTPRSIVYDAAHQQIFSSDYFLDRVDVVSTATRQLVKSIPVLNPSGLALTIDGSQVLVGSDTQQVQAISTSSLQIVNHWLPTPISGSTYGIQTPFPLADGTVAFRPSGYSVLSGELGI